jgi:hypothetical protein
MVRALAVAFRCPPDFQKQLLSATKLPLLVDAFNKKYVPMEMKEAIARNPYQITEVAARFYLSKKKVGAGIGATPTWGYCVLVTRIDANTHKKFRGFRKLT